MGIGLLSVTPKDWFQCVAEGCVAGYEYFNQFGINSLVTTITDPEDLWEFGGLYNFSSTADITQLTSSDNSDTQTVRVKGLDANWNRVDQTAILTGQTPKELDTALIRVYEVENISESSIAGTVYLTIAGAEFAAGVPDTASEVRATINNGNNRALMAIFSVPANKVCYFYGGFINQTSETFPKTASMVVDLLVRPFGGQFALRNRIILDTNNSNWQRQFPFPGTIPAKADIVVRINEVTDDSGLAGGFSVLIKDN